MNVPFLLQNEQINCNEIITGFSPLFNEKKKLFLSKIPTLRIKKRKCYFADRPTVFLMLFCP